MAEKKSHKRHVRQGDKVAVIAGKHKGQQGVVQRVLVDRDRVFVEGVVRIKRHLKPGRDPKHERGGIITRTGSLHISNVLVVDPSTNKPTRVGVKIDENGRKVRFAKSSGTVIPEVGRSE